MFAKAHKRLAASRGPREVAGHIAAAAATESRITRKFQMKAIMKLVMRKG